MSAKFSSGIKFALHWLISIALLVCVLVVARMLWVFRDRFPGYSLLVHVDAPRTLAPDAVFRVGFSQADITPKIDDPAHPVWIAGFSQGRLAKSVHDPLRAVAMVIDDGKTRIGIVSLDAIGFFHDDVLRVREKIPEALRLTHTIVCSTHNHSTPDLMGLWGPNVLTSGVDSHYKQQVIHASVKALVEASGRLQPARMAAHEIETSPAGLVKDTRPPEVYDPDIRVLHFIKADSTETIGSLITWANHPETPWSENQDLTADFPGYIRDALEKGIVYGDQIMQPGLGGIHMYINGAVGGLMTTHPSTTVHDPFLNRDFKDPSHDKTRALGNNLAQRILNRLHAASPSTDSQPTIGIRARTLDLPMPNNGFLLAGFLGLINRGHVGWRKIRSEIAVLSLGDASIACIPGEIYPEIVNGGIVRAPGGDFDIEPLEIPPLRTLMPGKVKFIFGLANDEIGYIIPKSEWDNEPPFLFHSHSRPYGEVNSLGPNTASLLHQALSKELLILSKSSRPTHVP